jgi:hypothetical protein
MIATTIRSSISENPWLRRISVLPGDAAALPGALVPMKSCIYEHASGLPIGYRDRTAGDRLWRLFLLNDLG